MSTIQFFTDRNCQESCDLIDGRQDPLGATPFELRMFLVDIGVGRSAWYGSLQNLNEGKKHYFRGWSGLMTTLQGILTPGGQLEVLKTLLVP